MTGHSLGAGTATLLSLMLKKTYPDVRCIAYSPPGCLVSHTLARFTKSFIMSVVVGDDIVPRLSIRSVHNLKGDILKQLYGCSLPKYKIIWKYSLSCFSRAGSNDSSDDTEEFYESVEVPDGTRSPSDFSSGFNSPAAVADIDGSDVEDGRKVNAQVVSATPIMNTANLAVSSNEDPLNLSSNSASSQRQLIVFSDDNEIIGKNFLFVRCIFDHVSVFHILGRIVA